MKFFLVLAALASVALAHHNNKDKYVSKLQKDIFHIAYIVYFFHLDKI